MKQQSFATGDFECYCKPMRREQFLSEMDNVVPWKTLCKRIEPFYPKAGNGRPPVGLERMLRICSPALVQPIGFRCGSGTDKLLEQRRSYGRQESDLRRVRD